MKKKRLLISLLSLMVLLSTAFAFFAGVVFASNDKTTAFESEVMASIRISNDATVPNGMRFKLKLGQTEYEALIDTTDGEPVYKTGCSINVSIMPKTVADSINNNDWTNIPSQAIVSVDAGKIYLDENYY